LFSFELATPEDDPAIRRLLATNPVPGSVTIAFEREPNYFIGCGTMGRFYQVLVARCPLHVSDSGPRTPDIGQNSIIGVACRAIRPLFVNGQIEEVGYLGQLRVDNRFQGRWIVSGGFHFLRELDADRRVAGYLATITEESATAKGILVDRPRRHFPAFREVDRLCTLALICKKAKGKRQKAKITGVEISHGSEKDLSTIIGFFKQHGPAKQFFPAYKEDDFRNGSTTLGFRIEDFILAYRNDELVGVIGLWDQSDYKQTVVQAYKSALRWIRPFYNVGAPLLGVQPLPSSGQRVRFVYGSFICVAENDLDIFSILLRRAYGLATQRGYACLMIGLTERDPLLTVLKQYAHIPYYSRLYTVQFEHPGGSFHERLDSRVAYVEIAAL
jgi:hypothetical protein